MTETAHDSDVCPRGLEPHQIYEEPGKICPGTTHWYDHLRVYVCGHPGCTFVTKFVFIARHHKHNCFYAFPSPREEPSGIHIMYPVYRHVE